MIAECDGAVVLAKGVGPTIALCRHRVGNGSERGQGAARTGLKERAIAGIKERKARARFHR
jgi:hypothetical protein